MTKNISYETWKQKWEKHQEWRASHPFFAWLTDIPHYPRRLWNLYSDGIDSIYDFFERGLKGYANRDTWGWTIYNAKLQAKVLKHLRDNKHGYPSCFTDKEWRIAEAKWNIALDKMIDAFELIVEINEGDYINLGYNPKKEAVERITKDKKFKVVTNSQLDKIKEGLELYVKYYESFWD